MILYTDASRRISYYHIEDIPVGVKRMMWWGDLERAIADRSNEFAIQTGGMVEFAKRDPRTCIAGVCHTEWHPIYNPRIDPRPALLVKSMENKMQLGDRGCRNIVYDSEREAWSNRLRELQKEARQKDRHQVLVQPMFDPWD